MKRILLTIIVFIFFVSTKLYAQKLPILNNVLRKGSVSLLNDYIIHNEEVFSNEFRENSIYWRLYREVLPGYYEGTLQIIFTEPYSEWRHKQFRQQIRVLAKDSTIFYFQILGLDSFNKYKLAIDSFSNDLIYAQFLEDFFQTYKSKLNIKYLFIDSLNYGDSCSATNNVNIEHDKMLFLVANKNIKLLNEWLRCGNSELQLFAVKGFFNLKEKNIKINDETLNIIHLILQKKGNINFCFNGYERRIQIEKLRRDYLNDQ